MGYRCKQATSAFRAGSSLRPELGEALSASITQLMLQLPVPGSVSYLTHHKDQYSASENGKTQINIYKSKGRCTGAVLCLIQCSTVKWKMLRCTQQCKKPSVWRYIHPLVTTTTWRYLKVWLCMPMSKKSFWQHGSHFSSCLLLCSLGQRQLLSRKHSSRWPSFEQRWDSTVLRGPCQPRWPCPFVNHLQVLTFIKSSGLR